MPLFPANLAIDVQPREDAGLAARAQALVDELGIGFCSQEADVVLMVTPRGLELHEDSGESKHISGNPVRIDLEKLDTKTGPGRSLANPLLKAVGIRKGQTHRPHVLDITAGYGEDAWLLASAGCSVTAVERHPLLFAMLRDALRRAGETQTQIADRIGVQWTDGHSLLGPRAPNNTSAWDVVYLDPMFPTARRKAAERKPMRLARRLVGDDQDATSLLDAALATSARRVVVKRPRRSKPLAGRCPVTSHYGKALRFDVYHPASV